LGAAARADPVVTIMSRKIIENVIQTLSACHSLTALHHLFPVSQIKG